MVRRDQDGVDRAVSHDRFDIGRMVAPAEFVTCLRGSLLDGIDIGDEIQLRHPSGAAQMTAPHASAPDQGHIDSSRHLAIPPCLFAVCPRPNLRQDLLPGDATDPGKALAVRPFDPG